MAIDILTMSDLVELGRDIALFVKVLRSDLSDVHVNHVSIVAVDLHHLISVASINVDVVRRADVFMRQDDLRLAVLVSRSFHVPDLQVALLLLLIDFKEEVFLCDDLIVGTLGELFS